MGTAAIPKVSVYTDSSGEPGISLYVLTNPSTLESSAVNTFFAPGGATLDAETQYWVVFENDNRSTSSADHYYISGTDSDAEDTGAASGWSISDLRSHRVEVDGTWSRHDVALCIPVQGSAKPDTALRDLELQDTGGNTITLYPPFSHRTALYTAYADNGVDQVTVSGTPSDDNATIEYLHHAGAAIADADSTKNGLQVALTVGDTTVNVKVTAGDGTTTQTHTVVITRLGSGSILVSNTGQPSDPYGGRATGMLAQGFSTGAKRGYLLSSVEFNMRSYTGTDLLVRVAPGNSNRGNPDFSDPSEVVTLNNPDTISANALNVYTAPACTILKPNTIYYIVVTSADGQEPPGSPDEDEVGLSGQYLRTLHREEDTNSAPGWTIPNSYLSMGAAADDWTYYGNSIVKIRVNGVALGSADATLSHLHMEDANGNPLDFSPKFRKTRQSYRAEVEHLVEQITLISIPSHPRPLASTAIPISTQLPTRTSPRKDTRST